MFGPSVKKNNVSLYIKYMEHGKEVTTVYYSQFEACHILGVAYTTLRRWVKKYHITYRRSVAGKIRLSEAGLQKQPVGPKQRLSSQPCLRFYWAS